MGTARGNGKNPFEEIPPPENGENGEDGQFRDCPLETDLERLVLEGENAPRREELSSHLGNCFACHEVYEKLVQFYGASLRDGLGEGKLPGMPPPPPELFTDYIVHLLPHVAGLERGENPEDLYTHLSSLSSHEGKVKGRFLLSRETGEILASFQSDRGERLSNVIFMVPLLRKKFLTDSRGIAVIGRKEPGLFMDAHVKLYLPLLRFTTNVGRELNQEETVNLTSLPGFPVESVLVYLDEESSLCAEFSFGSEEISPHLTALCVGRGKPEITQVTEGIALFKKPHLGGPLEVSVFPG
jgi:hypothetical protein